MFLEAVRKIRKRVIVRDKITLTDSILIIFKSTHLLLEESQHRLRVCILSFIFGVIMVRHIISSIKGHMPGAEADDRSRKFYYWVFRKLAASSQVVIQVYRIT